MPNRILKESIKRCDQIDQLTWFEEVVYYRLLVTADDYGILDGRPTLLKNELFPTRENVTKKAVEDAIRKLVKVGLLRSYDVSDKPYLCLPTWETHQNIRRPRHKYPMPQDNNIPPSTDGTLRSSGGNPPSTDGKTPPESNPIRIQSESESNPNPNPNPTRKREDIAAVVDAYLNKISPTPSQTSLEELTAYVNTMGKDCCLRAIDKALDAGVRNWYYVRKVLRVKASQGVRCLADWDAIDEKNEKLGGRVYGETAIGSSTQDSPYHLEALEL